MLPLLLGGAALACCSTDDEGSTSTTSGTAGASSVVTIDPVIGTSLRLLESRDQLFVIVISNLSSGSVETPLFIELQRLDDDGWINAGYVPFVGVNPTSVAHLCAKLAGCEAAPLSNLIRPGDSFEWTLETDKLAAGRYRLVVPEFTLSEQLATEVEVG